MRRERGVSAAAVPISFAGGLAGGGRERRKWGEWGQGTSFKSNVCLRWTKRVVINENGVSAAASVFPD